ncbi:ribosome silencing factor [Alloalcanivorax profundimaris]|jgi:ribosome-associated protein|uniref:Ribosomal silencing factor RsfS n=1 Tax=Alloalcanivorax profundimaris TaxID=2735259 RepID=A0ABS0AYF8_9GAMM|nr:ribosome silencing factor [Alloalcanivorax profundimaris]MAO59373.1 ribosome silencing factor [Alcanivorax sp.]MBM1143518.1 ribosome silencing factor [Alcanivorax sp. ZXX171]MCQ6261171.1 ribosome silencing factor [Alcanivorax sp. MM125-6]UWN51136.1 Ribosomal silencing factor RsfS [Alcanivorax sp. ALC70]MAY12103.1 ribosome silencing factor [Alcanivorax sp.]
MSSQPPLLDLVLDALEELKAKNIASLDVRAMTSVADDMVIASGTSSRHVKALADNVMEKAKDAGYRPLGTEGERGAEWILVDLGDIIVHLMLPATREFYDLERLWRTPDHHPDRDQRDH